MYTENRTVYKEVTYDNQAKSGWTCPKCHNTIAPDVKVCPKCEVNITESKSDNKQILNG